MARAHRQALGIPVIAIGGSNGKTSTREYARVLLSEQFNVHTNIKNENNHIGVPKTILTTPSKTDILLLELGSNHIGETEVLLNICQPSHVLLTNNGKDHIGEYGSYEAVSHENFALYRYAESHPTTELFVPAWQSELVTATENIPRTTFDCIAYSNELPLVVNFNDNAITTILSGKHNAENISNAIVITESLGVSIVNIENALPKLKPFSLRGEMVKKESATILVDCYNANPSSMEIMIEFFAENAPAPRGLILSGMRELGEFSRTEHESLVQFIQKFEWDYIALVGSEFEGIRIPENVNHYATTKEADNAIQWSDLTDYHILLKGSRFYTLEYLIN